MASGDLAFLVQGGAATLHAGETQVGVHDAKVALLVPGATPTDYALYAQGDAMVSVAGGLIEASGTFTIQQNKSATHDVLAQTITIGSGVGEVSVMVPLLAANLESITGTDVQVHVGEVLTVEGNVGLVQDMASGDLAFLVQGGAATLHAGETQVGVHDAKVALLVPGATPSDNAPSAPGVAMVSLPGGLPEASGTFTI